jgi:hypothetical protein
MPHVCIFQRCKRVVEKLVIFSQKMDVQKKRSQLPMYCLHLRYESRLRALSDKFDIMISNIEQKIQSTISDDEVEQLFLACRELEDLIQGTPSVSGLPIVHVLSKNASGMTVTFEGEIITGSADDIAKLIALKKRKRS